ncbi:MAG TPA: FkbM family methyltransferase [Acidimicrobiales bacterium]|nr:FkbM family methyltransferase [Acidimicrobiales bacterium]
MEPTSRHIRQVVKLVINYRGQRRTVLRQEIFDLVGRVSPVIAIDSDSTRYLVSTRDRGLSRTVFGLGSYEQDVMGHTITLAEKHIGRVPLLAGRTFVDIGANIGTSTVPALTVFGAADAVAIEPDADNYKLLRCNLIVNDLEDRARTVRAAVSDREGTGVLELDGGSWGDHRVRIWADAPDGQFRESSRPTVSVPLTRFDDVARELPIDLDNVGLVWMDVQGHEGHVLAGASSLLARDIPVAMEYWPYGLRRAQGLTLLHDLIRGAYRTVVDVRASMTGSGPAEVPASQVHTLSERYDGEAYTDLLLLK